MLLALVGLAILVVRSYFILPTVLAIVVVAAVPGCGVGATVAGVVGIRRGRAADDPKAIAVLGLLGGIGLLVLCGATLLLFWAVSHSNWQF